MGRHGYVRLEGLGVGAGTHNVVLTYNGYGFSLLRAIAVMRDATVLTLPDHRANAVFYGRSLNDQTPFRWHWLRSAPLCN